MPDAVAEDEKHRLTAVQGLAALSLGALSLGALSPVAYGPEAILAVLVAAGTARSPSPSCSIWPTSKRATGTTSLWC
jgi:hypothetical protein